MTGSILNRCCPKLISVLLCTFVYWGKLSCIGEYFSVFTIPIRKKINLLFVQSNIFKSRSDMCRCNDLLILTLGFTEPTQNTSTVYIMMHILNKADSVIWIHANITGSNIYIHFICFQVDFVPGHSIILQIYCHQIVKISNEPNNQYTRGQSDKCSTLRNAQNQICFYIEHHFPLARVRANCEGVITWVGELFLLLNSKLISWEVRIELDCIEVIHEYLMLYPGLLHRILDKLPLVLHVSICINYIYVYIGQYIYIKR